MNPHGNVAGDPVNEATSKPVRTRSRFPSLSYHMYNTERFGEYNVPFVMDCVEGDKVPIRSGGNVSSYSLKAPLMQSISKKKDFYLVPMQAILPLNFDKFYTNPTVGDDVPDNVGTGVIHFWTLVYNLWNALKTAVNTELNDANATSQSVLNCVIRSAVIGEYFFSYGSLIKTLGCSGSRFCKFRFQNQAYSYDAWFDQLMASILSTVQSFDFIYEGRSFVCLINETSRGYIRTSSPVVTFRTFLQMMREDLTTYIASVTASSVSAVKAAVINFFDNSKWADQTVSVDLPYDTRRLWAYQLAVAHFYTNDFIDFVYSADLFRSVIQHFCFSDYNGGYNHYTFTCNGVGYQYDAMSAYCTNVMFTNFTGDCHDVLVVTNQTSNAGIWRKNHLAYFSYLFSYRRSLRYVDYFTGARSRPLAVGDVNVNVNSNQVNVIDVSRNIQRQRFFNFVNRIGRKIEDYIEGLSGERPAVDYHNPLYLAHTKDTVFGVEVENTGAAQQNNANSITSRFQTNGSRYQFEFEVDRPCVVIGISYYDMPRAYISATERQLFYLNRFDMFNPFMQFIGDQSVEFAELGSLMASGNTGTFGYQLRHMEYKQRFDQAAGGFVESLPGFLFTDREFGGLANFTIDPNFIRSLNSELDSFYVSLTGYSLGHYFHFIVDNDNSCDASRPMAYAPSIL